MDEKEFNFNEEMMPYEETKENIENMSKFLKKKAEKVLKRAKNLLDKEKNKKENDDENDERANMFEEWYRKEQDKRYKINFLISDYYTKHIQELEKSIVEKDELINKIYEISNKY